MCSNPKSPYLTLANEQQMIIYWFRADCDLWSCPECAKKRKTRVMARAGRGTEYWQSLGIDCNLTTLTCNAKVREFHATIRIWRDAWPRLRKRAARRCQEFHYCLIPEQHEDGAVHVHLLETSGLEQRWWRDTAPIVGLGWSSETHPVRTYADGARYASKYLGKSVGVANWPSNYHRFRFSRQWPDWSPDSHAGEQWRVHFSAASLDDEMRHWLGQGFKIVNTTTGEIT